MRWDLHLDLTLQIPLVEKATVGLAHYSHGKVRASGLFMCNTLCWALDEIGSNNEHDRPDLCLLGFMVGWRRHSVNNHNESTQKYR